MRPDSSPLAQSTMTLRRPHSFSPASFRSSKLSPSLSSAMSNTSTSCSLCGDEFSSNEAYLKVDKTFWHPKCFKCAQCFCDLSDQVYFNVEGRNYCQYDFEVNYAPWCQGCKTYVLEGSVVKAVTGTFHAECFVCDECRGSLEDGVWIVEGSKLCYECKEKRRVQPAYVCAKCRHTIEESELLRYRNDVFHAYHFNCKDCQAVLTGTARQLNDDLFCARCYDKRCEVCFDCKRVIDPEHERSILAMNRHFHVEHFKCAHCALVFRDQAYYVMSDAAYCLADYTKLFRDQCFACGRLLPGESVRIFGKCWCKECYRCRACDHLLSIKDKVMEEDMLPVCKKCMKQKNFKKVLDHRHEDSAHVKGKRRV